MEGKELLTTENGNTTPNPNNLTGDLMMRFERINDALLSIIEDLRGDGKFYRHYNDKVFGDDTATPHKAFVEDNPEKRDPERALVYQLLDAVEVVEFNIERLANLKNENHQDLIQFLRKLA